jgi:hypothetical protein
MSSAAYEGYFNDGRFYASGKVIQIPEKRRVVITILEETRNTNETESIAENESAREWLDDLFEGLQDATIELEEKDFPRINFREQILFGDEENL